MKETTGKLRSYKGCAFIDAGPEVIGEPQHHILQVYGPTNNLCHSIRFDSFDPAGVNKAIEQAKEWVNQAQGLKEDQNTPRYSDEDLKEFKAILDKKYDAAVKEFNYLQGLVMSKKTADDPPKDLSETEVQQLSQMLTRQETFLEHLTAALERIKNRTYGICRVTGKLIDKQRLLAVPHATLSLEGKQMADKNPQQSGTPELKEMPEKKKRTPRKPKISNNADGSIENNDPVIVTENKDPMGNINLSFEKDIDTTGLEGEEVEPVEIITNTEPERKCRVCGCTQDNCKQCIEKTGQPCSWVEYDLCSACVDEPELKVVDSRASTQTEVRTDNVVTIAEGLSTNFFTQLTKTVKNLDCTIRIMEKDDKLTVGIFPSIKSKMKPVNMAGTPEQIDEGFFSKVVPNVKDVPGLLTNVEDVKKSATEVKPAAKKSKPKSKPKKKWSAVKKEVAAKKKKPAPAKKVSAPKKNKSKAKPASQAKPEATPPPAPVVDVVIEEPAVEQVQ
jgi:PRTRC genetic system protein E